MRYLQAEIKDASSKGYGSFVARASTPTIDRDGERLAAKCFDPLPPDIGLHAFHDFHDPIGRAVPKYRGDDLWVEAKFASTARAQELRQLVLDGAVKHVSVGFMGSTRKDVDGVPTVIKAELLEVSLVSIPANREADIVSVRAFDPRMTPAKAMKIAAHALVDVALLDAKQAMQADNRRIIRKSQRFLASPEMALAEAKALLRELNLREGDR